ncbi:hypothetical protein [Xanthomonas theicola]|uniref:hypothetical protein n=1 Tax=Xanthomonas theicola TaxID=56464 RepID=UPI000FF8A853|nr:hypothetical protein [Xanthomonas theicola]QNH26269.1 hypothetical protein G4Q83_18135 [Xanthomonas theicola]
MFDPVTKRFNLIDFDYSEISYAVTDAHYKDMYRSLHSKIKQDFIVLLIDRLAKYPNKIERMRSAKETMEDRLENLVVDNGKPRISDFRSAVEDFDRDNRIYVSRGLRVLLNRKDIATVDARTLSAADGMGIRRDAGDNNYIRCDAGFLKMHRRNRLFFIEKKNGNLIHIQFKGGEFHPVKITSHRGLLTSSVQQMRTDRLINYKQGFEQETNTPPE